MHPDIAAAYRARGQAIPAGHSAATERDARLQRLATAEQELNAPLPAAGARAVRNAPGEPAKREFSSFGEFICAVAYNTDDSRLSSLYAEQRTDDGPSGGFAIPVTFRDELLSLKASPAVMRPRANVLPAGDVPDGDLIVPALDQSPSTNMYGGVQVAWIGEGGQKPQTDAKIRQVKLVPQEIAGLITVTDKLLRNWGASSSFLSENFRKAIAAAEDAAFLTGNGVGKPLGVLLSSAAISVNRGTANQISYADVLAMDETLLGDDSDAFWTCSKRAATWLRQLKNPGGYFIWHEDASAKSPATLLGHPVVISDRVPTLGNKGDLMLIDGSSYLIKDGSGPFVVASEHVHFTENKTVIKAFWNVDGQPWMKDPIKTENGDLQSPFVVLN